MLTSKFDLYKAEWLDLVFEDRNKSYGAYDLRRHYADNMLKALGTVFFACVLGVVAVNTIFKKEQKEGYRIIKDIPIPVIPQPKVTPPKKIEEPVEAKLSPPKKVATQRFVEMRPVEGAEEEPLKAEEITKQVAQETIAGPEKLGNEVIDKPVTEGPSGTGNQPQVDDNLYNVGTLEVMPEPYGGAAAWSKFLQKNMRYPIMAQEANIQGKVYVSFVIEKDGKLSNITIIKGPGYGTNEEALRVLKLAPAWKPGVQNGQNVRVKYTLPINFVLSDQ